MTTLKKTLDFIGDLTKINGATKKFFEKKNLFFSEKYGFPSYYAIRGKSPNELPPEIPLEYKTWPVLNQDKRDLQETLRACERLGRKCIDLSIEEDLLVRHRDYMIEGSTLPIRITYERQQKRKTATPQNDAIYVKEINLNRIYLGYLYALATATSPNFFFSENSVIEREVKGPSLFEAYNQQPDFLAHPHWKREVIKLGVLTNFLSLYDCDNGYNILVNRTENCIVIDFDKAFWEKIPDPAEQIINPFVYRIKKKNKTELHELPDEKLARHFSRGELENMIKQEKRKIATNINFHLPEFYEVLDAMSQCKYYNAAAQELYGEKDVTSYFLKKHFEFSRA